MNRSEILDEAKRLTTGDRQAEYGEPWRVYGVEREKNLARLEAEVEGWAKAEQEGRRAYVMELDPRFCDVIIKRWENLTGERAVKL